MRSWQSFLFEKFLLMRGSKKKFINLQLMDQFIAEKYNALPYELDKKFQEKHEINQLDLNGMTYYVVNGQINPKKVIFYFHGGAYINDPLIFHWRHLVKLAEKTNYTIVVPIYPKLPRFTYVDAFTAIHALYDKLLKQYDAPFIFMGDSAGGGLALALAQDVKLHKKKQPAHVVLYSPWLDVSGLNPEYKEIEKIDPMLGLAGAQKLGKLWAGPSDIMNNLISPLHGPIDGIGKIALFVGSSEMLIVDARMFLEKAKKEDVGILYFEYPKMNHVFPVFPIPEASRALNTVVSIITED
ncbi:MAG: alpha/beta hydrolase [Solibacillus sp.]